MKSRIEFIDCMRGFTMILVVYSHVILFSYHLDYKNFIGDIFMLFRMPLFFFVSGFLAYTTMNTSKWISKMKKRIQGQLIPTVFMLTLYELWINNYNFSDFIAENKNGYWFTIVVFNLFVCFSLINLICDYFKARNIVKLSAYALLIFAGHIIVRLMGGGRYYQSN